MSQKKQNKKGKLLLNDTLLVKILMIFACLSSVRVVGYLNGLGVIVPAVLTGLKINRSVQRAVREAFLMKWSNRLSWFV